MHPDQIRPRRPRLRWWPLTRFGSITRRCRFGRACGLCSCRAPLCGAHFFEWALFFCILCILFFGRRIDFLLQLKSAFSLCLSCVCVLLSFSLVYGCNNLLIAFSVQHQLCFASDRLCDSGAAVSRASPQEVHAGTVLAECWHVSNLTFFFE